MNLRELVTLIGKRPVNNGLFQAMAKTLDGRMDGLKFERDNTRKDVRCYTHPAESLGVPSAVGEGVHQSLAPASALGLGKGFVPARVQAQEKLTGAVIVPG